MKNTLKPKYHVPTHYHPTLPKHVRRELRGKYHLHSGRPIGGFEIGSRSAFVTDQLYSINGNPAIWIDGFDFRPNNFLGAELVSDGMVVPYTMRGEIDFLVRVGTNAWETRRGSEDQFDRRFISPRHLLYNHVLDRLRNHHYFGMYFQQGPRADDAIILGNSLLSIATRTDAVGV